MQKKFAVLFFALLLLFGAVGVPAGAADALPADGQYTVEVTLSGGTGRATVASPAAVVVKNGQATLTVVWSSPNYDRMTVAGTDYAPVNQEGNSTFEIPVTALDGDLACSAETTAMGAPHTIDYTLHLSGSTLRSASAHSPWPVICLCAAVLAAAAVIAVLSVRRRRKADAR